jgi:predicted nucleic acid-binding protein
VPVTEEIYRQAAKYVRAFRRSHPDTGPTDYLIAAMAVVPAAQLLTTNVRNFGDDQRPRPR